MSLLSERSQGRAQQLSSLLSNFGRTRAQRTIRCKVGAKNKISLWVSCCLTCWIWHARAADVYWTNLAGGNWSTAANWNSGVVPGVNDNAFLISNGNYTVNLDISAT